ncbi:carbohydrate ABC transporter permease [Bifidobacterium choloepi]|uniref:Carbohydrate ABC transporter permease n=1 Tax=Bifidobacterium choloepi TaxID=2614131 RepID=A0A6I5N893_9BIFI|nr:carbohydrate ABC transporter permease [Bifidobacterium choloepi]NEG70061.1 carbohydrate ABC transporter permease [Bifidobacterium choloepi]
MTTVINPASSESTRSAKDAEHEAKRRHRAQARAAKRADRIREKAEHDLPRSMQPNRFVKTITVIVLVVVLIYFLFPIYWAIIASTKTPAQLTGSNGLWFAVGLQDLPNAIATNYTKLLGWTKGEFWRWVLNSLIYSGASALIGTVVAVMAGYATAKFNFRGKGVIIGVIMASMLMPAALMTIPQYSIFNTLGLDNTMLSIIIPCSVSPFGFFLGRVYAQSSVPDELLEAARIDGAGEARIFFTIVLRILAPAMVTIFLFLFVATWNNFLLPLMMISDSSLQPVTLGLYGMVSLATFTDRGALMMGALLGVLPVIVLFLFLQRYWQSGLAAGSVKG